MRLQYIRIDSAASCGGLLDGVELSIGAKREGEDLMPICLIGKNGTGKSQLLQLIGEIFQAAWHQFSPAEEKESSNAEALFEVQYQVVFTGKHRTIRLKRAAEGKRPSLILMSELSKGEWVSIEAKDRRFGENLPTLIVGYTSGDNETLSLPFLVSRGGYAEAVREAAMPLKKGSPQKPREVADNRLLLIDYSTHLEVLVANLLLARENVRSSIIGHANLIDLASFRCILQLNHSAAPTAPKGAPKNRKGIQLTDELERYVSALSRSATSYHYNEQQEIYTFDFVVDGACRQAFRTFFGSSIELYRALHKLSLLNDLAIPKPARVRLKKEVETRRFASRLPEPQDEDKVFRFEQVQFRKRSDGQIVDYVSLSDGEHQFAQILGVFSMLTRENILFLLDEPESHFNPQWRVKFTKMLIDLPVDDRREQELLLTTHAPFVPCDLPRSQVLIFNKGAVGRVTITPPDMETFGATFDRILESCFGVRPPISQIARDEIGELLNSGSVDQIRAALDRLGPSVEKTFLADRLRQLSKP